MTIEQLRATVRAVPFRPFRLHLADGGSLDVAHPDFVSSSPGGRTIVVWQPDESFQIADLLLVSRIEILNGQSAAR
jgi:hypothetical protein